MDSHQRNDPVCAVDIPYFELKELIQALIRAEELNPGDRSDKWRNQEGRKQE